MSPDSDLCLRVVAHLVERSNRDWLIDAYEADDPERTAGAPKGQKFVDLIATTAAGVTIAAEHTVIESYAMQLEDARQIEAILAPLEARLEGQLPSDRTYLLSVGIGAVRDRTLVPTDVQDAVAAWVEARAPNLPAGHPSVAPDHIARASPPELPVELGLAAWPASTSDGAKGGLRVSRFVGDATAMAEMRVARFGTAFDNKLPKLLAQGATRSVLVLEDRDLATSNIVEVVVALRAAAEGRELCDTIVVVETWLPTPRGVVVYDAGVWTNDFAGSAAALPTTEASRRVRGGCRVDKGEAISAHDECSNAHGRPLEDPAHHVGNWYRAFVDAEELRTSHGDFHGRPWPNGKERRMVENLADVRQEVEAGTWPCSDEIRSGPTDAMPAVHLERCSNGHLYLIDGQLRCMTALWCGVQEIDAYIVDLPERHRPAP